MFAYHTHGEPGSGAASGLDRETLAWEGLPSAGACMMQANHASSWLALEDRTCVVTGAGGGIGRATALAFAAAGARLVLLERDEANLAITAKEIASPSGQDVVTLACDVTDQASVQAAAAKAERAVGRCHILVNNAGILRPGALASITLAQWNEIMSVNLTGYFLCAQAFGRQMRDAGGGAIVHIASIAASEPQGASGAYSVSKAGVAMLSRLIALEWGPAVRSNVVSPGLVETPLSQAFYQVEGVRERRSAMTPAKRIGRPQDMADAALFLASDRASYITGQELIVDGGLSQTLMSLVPRPGY
jgi:NAD(P)-dependent dehydrogenase (short-subunit alcohol dehydrogenase family)